MFIIRLGAEEEEDEYWAGRDDLFPSFLVCCLQNLLNRGLTVMCSSVMDVWLIWLPNDEKASTAIGRAVGVLVDYGMIFHIMPKAYALWKS